ncbi:MAG: hypothetical protein ACLQIB_57150 [Isosphaeraceae bacterium]
MTDLVRSILSSAAVNVLLTAGLVYLARTWIGERLKKSIEHEYLVALERLRADNAQYQSVQATAMSSFSASRHAAIERRLNSIEKLWSAILKLKAVTPAAVAFADNLLATEYEEFHKNRKLVEVLQYVSLHETTEEMKSLSEVEECRLYIGETVYLLFFIYRAVTARLVFLFEKGRGKR